MAIEVVYLISNEDMKTESIINGNVDDKLIKPTIIDVQDMQIQRIIGTDLLNEIKNQVRTDSLTAANTILLNEYIRPCLKKYVVAEFTVPGVLRVYNRTTGTNNSENGSPLSKDEMVLMHQHFQTRAEFYAEGLRKFLIQNSSTYPLYYNGNSGVDKMRPKSNQLFPGLVLQKTSYRGNYGRGNYPTTSIFAENNGCCNDEGF